MLYIPNDTCTYKYIVLSIAYRRHFVQRRHRLLPQRPSTPRSFYRRELTTKETWHQKILHQMYVQPSTSRELFHRSGWQSSARRQVRAQRHIIAVLSLPPAQVCWARLDADPRQQDTTQHHTACGAHKNQNLTICGEKITKSGVNFTCGFVYRYCRGKVFHKHSNFAFSSQVGCQTKVRLHHVQ